MNKKIMRRVVFISLIMLAFVTSTFAYAAEITKISYDMGKIKVYGLAEKNSDVRLVITDAQASLNDIDAILAIKEFKSNSDGSFTSVVSISEMLKGESSPENIVLSIKEKGGSKDTETLVYAYESEINSLLSEIKIEESVKFAFEDDDKKRILTVIGLSVEGLESLSESTQSEMLEIFDENFDFSNWTGSEMAKEFNSMLGLGFINDDNEYGYSLLSAEFSNNEYVNITDDNRKKYINEYVKDFKPYKDYESFYTVYDEANVLYDVNNSLSSSLFTILDDYSDVLEISQNSSFLKLKGLTGYERGVIVDTLIKNIRKSEVTRKSELIGLLESAISSSSKNKPQSGGGSGGGGGSRGSASGVPLSPIFNTDEIENVVSGFSDFSNNHWAYEPVMKLFEKGVINGYEDGSFRPENSVTRAEFIKMIVLASDEINANANCDFSDVGLNDWFRPAVATAFVNEIVKGSDGLFRPYDNISRQEAATIIYRQMLHKGISLKEIRDSMLFSDNEYIGDYAKDAVDALYKCGIIDGAGELKFKPMDSCTRSQAAKLIYMAFCK